MHAWKRVHLCTLALLGYLVLYMFSQKVATALSLSLSLSLSLFMGNSGCYCFTSQVWETHLPLSDMYVHTSEYTCVQYVTYLLAPQCFETKGSSSISGRVEGKDGRPLLKNYGYLCSIVCSSAPAPLLNITAFTSSKLAGHLFLATSLPAVVEKLYSTRYHGGSYPLT
jgi:hypothetical protein